LEKWSNDNTSIHEFNLSDAYAIATSGNDVYITGVDNGNAVYWKNGTEFILGGGAAKLLQSMVLMCI